jgi:uncharacterized protein
MSLFGLFGKFSKPSAPDVLCGAIMRGESDLAKKILLKGKINLDATYGGNTPLAWAAGGYGAIGPSKELVRLLLDCGAGVNAAGEGGTTALERAAMVNAPSVVDMLVAGGADVNQKDSTRNTPLMTALLCGCEEAAVLLIEKGTEIEGRSTHSNCPGYSPLMLAIEGDMPRAAEMLLERGAKLEHVNDKGFSAHYARSGEMKEIVKRYEPDGVALARDMKVSAPLRLSARKRFQSL